MLNDKVSKWCEIKKKKLSFSIFSRLKIDSCVFPKFTTICRMFERVQETKFTGGDLLIEIVVVVDFFIYV
jgi:hypothetical protein